MSLIAQIDLAQQEPTSSVGHLKLCPPSGISILIVGAGVGGLMSALECRRKGHNVRIIERTPTPSTAGNTHHLCQPFLPAFPQSAVSDSIVVGDFFTISPNIICHFCDVYPDLAAECEQINYPAWLSYHRITGEAVSEPEPITLLGELEVTAASGIQKNIAFQRQNRPKFVAALMAQAKKLGIDIAFGNRVVNYFEKHETAGVVLDDGTTLTADLVIAADGIGTKSYGLVNGEHIRTYPSGFSIFRTAFPVELALKDPKVAARWPLIDGQHSHIEMWGGYVLVSFFGPHGIAALTWTYPGRKDMNLTIQRYRDIMSWALTHKVRLIPS